MVAIAAARLPSFSVEAANHQLIRESRSTLRHPAWWALTTEPGASGPSHSDPRPRCADAAPGSSLVCADAAPGHLLGAELSPPSIV